MMKLKTTENLLSKVEETINIFNNLPKLSRINTVLTSPLKVINSKKMDYIFSRTIELNDKIYNFSKSTSQTSRKLQSLTMLMPADCTYSVLQQILAQIEKKQQAINENTIKFKKELLEIDKKKNKIMEIDDTVEKSILELEIQDLEVKLANSFSYIEAALKELGFLVESYEQIKQSKNISDEWDEKDFEKAEIKTHIKGAFRNAIRDSLTQGRIGMGTIEWFEQFGISPFEAIYEVSTFINGVSNKKRPIDYDEMYDFLNEMAEKYKDCYKKACKRIGLNEEVISEQFTLNNKVKNFN